VNSTCDRLEQFLCRNLPAVVFDAVVAADEVVVFGSCAAGLAEDDSDLDILCIGSGMSVHSPEFDLVWLPREKTHSAEWLQSELANHVGEFGVWMKGESGWRGSQCITSHTLMRKMRMIARRLKGVMKAKSFFSSSELEREITIVQRDMIRLELMRRGLPVPPRQMLTRYRAESVESIAKVVHSTFSAERALELLPLLLRLSSLTTVEPGSEFLGDLGVATS
jgi:hypothetical protein